MNLRPSEELRKEARAILEATWDFIKGGGIIIILGLLFIGIITVLATYPIMFFGGIGIVIVGFYIYMFWGAFWPIRKGQS